MHIHDDHADLIRRLNEHYEGDRYAIIYRLRELHPMTQDEAWDLVAKVLGMPKAR